VRLYRRLLALQPGYPGARDGLKLARRRGSGALRPAHPGEPES